MARGEGFLRFPSLCPHPDSPPWAQALWTQRGELSQVFIIFILRGLGVV